ncbi:PREDICTED: two-component response regulator-like APRR9 isoform X2 [Populus euphratica]|uniref:Two-component response regulator-like APRR9 isoform X2 n=1 Tax=Populus euphratica TaxID=75702 RepID=A0AAJ6U913_POPEU|nr:PREDICTED: two-component response regulator-like APRR9 isoform X2 [Populus euphratica]
MGKVVVSSSSEEAGGMVVELETEKKDIGSSEVVRWEKFLPKMVLRVLLVEADDSTRQIIVALLRKCGYRVSAVPDGLMAWETLKERPHSIDLILTEVELPLISGYALLALVMEHDVCKNIPVIMMSSHDSISVVLKCMLKGAADFLVKPVRKNELRNLWQHVWRRQTLIAGKIPGNSHQVEAASENNAASSDFGTSLQKNKDCSEKGSDAQSSCTTPCLEAESAHMQNIQGLSHLKYRSASNLSDADNEKHEDYTILNKSPVNPESKTGVLVAEWSSRTRHDREPCHGAYNPTAPRQVEEHACAKSAIHDENSRPENDREHANSSFGHDDVLGESGAIDLIGSFNNRPKHTNAYSSLHDATNKFEFPPLLELSLRRLYPSSSKNQGLDERHALNHSNSSAFSLYNSKSLQSPFPTSASNGSDSKEEASKSPDLSSNQLAQNVGTVSQIHDVSLSGNQEIMTTPVIGQSVKVELAHPSPQLGLIPVLGTRLDNISTGCGHVFSPLCYTQSNAAWNPNLAGRPQSPFPTTASVRSNPEVLDSKQNQKCSAETTYCYVDQNDLQQNNREPVDEMRHDSPAAGQSNSSSLCKRVANNNNSSAYESFGSRNDVNASSVGTAEKSMAQENLNNGGNFNHDGFGGSDSYRSSQREAALTKFRLKRKDRCYEKRVRYQSRKRLAEQRPRVKGQFVRQMQNDCPVANG